MKATLGHILGRGESGLTVSGPNTDQNLADQRHVNGPLHLWFLLALGLSLDSVLIQPDQEIQGTPLHFTFY